MRRSTWLAGLMLSSMTACDTLAPAQSDSLCLATRPIYLSEGAIQALQPYRPERQAIAVHNLTWERACRPP